MSDNAYEQSEIDCYEYQRQIEFDRQGTTNTIVRYQSWAGHLMEYYEDENNPGKPGRAHAWASWHSSACACGGEPLPDY